MFPSSAKGLYAKKITDSSDACSRKKKIRYGILRDDLPDNKRWTTCALTGVFGEGVGLGVELPDENDINVFLVSSNIAVYRFWVYTYLARVTANIKQKMALKLTNTNTGRSDIFFVNSSPGDYEKWLMLADLSPISLQPNSEKIKRVLYLSFCCDS